VPNHDTSIQDKKDAAPACVKGGSVLSLVMDRATKSVRLMLGLPDYDTYVAFLKANKPAQPIPSREQFFKDRVDGRYRPGMAKGCG